MEQFFLTLVEMSITAAVLAVAVMLVRLLFRRAPRWIVVLLWGLVAIRLLCPVVPESSVSLMPTDIVSSESLFADRAETVPPAQVPATETVEAAEPFPWLTVAVAVWACGAGGMLLYTMLSYVRLRIRMREAVPTEGRVYVSDHTESPFILGLIRPRIYLPSVLDDKDRAVVLAHEQAHLKRLDHLWKPLGFLLLAFHWFNPLLWAAYLLLCRDIEVACDEKVVREHSLAQKKEYSEVLIRYSVSRSTVAACPIAFGETAVKERVKAVLFYKKPSFWLILSAVIVCAVLAVCFLTDPLTPLAQSSKAWATLLCTEYGHAFEDATCTENGVCRRCEAAGGMLPHEFAAATCLKGEVCTVCGGDGASALGHEFVGATCTAPAACTRCEATGDLLPHTFAAPTCETAETCTACGAVGENGALGHAFIEATCTSDGACTRCGAVGDPAHGHNYVAGFFEETCSYCGDTRHVHNVYVNKCVGYTCDTCGEYIGGTGDHWYMSVGMGYTATCVTCGHTEVTDPEGLRAFEAYRDSLGSTSSSFESSTPQTPDRESIRWDVIPNLQ